MGKTDTRSRPLDYNPDLNHPTVIRDLCVCVWGGAFNDFTEYLEQVSELRHGEGIRNTQDLKTLMRGRHIDYNHSAHSQSFDGDLREGLRKHLRLIICEIALKVGFI